MQTDDTTDRFRHHAARILQLTSLQDMKQALAQVPEKWRDTVTRYVRNQIALDRSRGQQHAQLPVNRAARPGNTGR